MTSRFVAGRTLAEGVSVLKNLSKDNMLGTLDYLGESVMNLAEAEQSRDSYMEALNRIHHENLSASVSLKLTQFGLDLSESACRENVRALVARASQIGSRVEIDMESTAYTDRTLDLVKEMQTAFPGHVRAVIQAYLFRSEADIKSLSSLNIPVRLCKGAYREPASLAFPDKADVDKNYLRLMCLLFLKGIIRQSQVMMRASSRLRYVIFRNKTLTPLVLSFRCSMEFAETFSASLFPKDSASASMCRTGTPGTPISCAASLSVRRISFSWPKMPSARNVGCIGTTETLLESK